MGNQKDCQQETGGQELWSTGCAGRINGCLGANWAMQRRCCRSLTHKAGHTVAVKGVMQLAKIKVGDRWLLCCIADLPPSNALFSTENSPMLKYLEI